MSRGRSRGRGRSNPIEPEQARGTSRSSRQHVRSRTTSRGPLRRSTRIAQSFHDQINSIVAATPEIMADVARLRTFDRRSMHSRHHNGPIHHSRATRRTLMPEDIRYALDVVVQPAHAAWEGYPISSGLIARLRTTNVSPDEALAHSSSLVALATLVPVAGSTAPTDPQRLNAVLAGRRVQSVHSFSDDESDNSIATMELDDGRGVGYIRFPDLAILQAGSYRIRITLIRIPTSGSGNPVAAIAGGAAIQVVDSDPIVIQGTHQAARRVTPNGKRMINNR